MARSSTRAAIAEMDARFAAFAKKVGDDIQALQNAPTSGLRWVSPPATHTAAGERGDIAADADNLYICYDENQWAQIPFITQF
jgi:hypothetical protein